MEEFSKYLKLPPNKKKFSLLDAISLDSTDANSPSSLSDFPLYMLRRIMLFDNSSRVLPKLVKSESNSSTLNPLSAFLDEDNEDGLVHPMDIFIYLFLNSHHIFRQILVNHVSKCLLSLPLITCDSHSKLVSFNHFAFQTLILSRYVDGDNAKNFSAVEEPLPIVSFIRVSDCQYSQKSELLNIILKINHEYFFHKNCNGNIKKRFFLDGTVEIAWYLTKSKRNIFINQHFIMLNLRGNACDFTKQTNFMGSISTLLYVFVPISELTREISKKLMEFHDNFNSKVIFLAYKGDPQNKKTNPELIPNILNDENKTIALRMKNIHQDSEIIANSISNELDKRENLALSLTDCVKIATQIGMSCDTLTEGIVSVQNIVDTICKDFPPILLEVESKSCMELATLKQRLLPLQGKFGQWAEANRELQHIKNDIRGNFEEYNIRLKESQLEVRKYQTDKLSQPSILLNGILKECQHIKNDKDRFFLFWNLLRNHLNTVSRKYLPFLYTEYKKWIKESYSVHPSLGDRAERISKQDEAKSNLTRAADSLTQSSIGIEHIIRELGQTYEAFLSNDAKMKVSLQNHLNFRPTHLPDVMANLILQGQAFEIVNGDDNHVSIQWVSDVLIRLSEIIGPEKKIFVISVLGIQSSGKSTLLNTMFGINFPVSSGRCTRGVFMQMIPVNSNVREQLGYDYLMLLDTEGLRAPELSGNLSYRKDNEMATFIVGLGDLALVNIRGESHSEVQDILQITVIAFIRMRQTFSKPRCIFVHQNVGDIEARTNLIVARKNLIDTLNEMTICAAQQENKDEQFCQFGDVIEFDPEEDVFYFPSYFEGDPPMTSISSGYIEKAEELRAKVITCCSNQNRNFQTVKEWRKKMLNLWNCVLRENFVFSYKNILELNCRVELDSALCSWHSHFAQEMATKKSKYFNILSNVETHKLKTALQEILNDFLENSKKITLELEQSILEEFFVRHEKNIIFQQWHSQAKRYFDSCRDKENRIVREECDLIFRVEEQKQIIDDKFMSYRKEIVKIVRDLFEKYSDQVSFETADSVKEYFNEIWTGWVAQIHFPLIDDADVPQNLQQALLDNSHLKQLDVVSEKTFLIKEVDKYKKVGMSEFDDLYIYYGDLVQAENDYFKIIDRQTHKIIFVTWFNRVKNVFSNEKDSNKAKYKKRLHSIIEALSDRIKGIIENFFPKNSNYTIDYFHVLIDKCVSFISEHNKAEKTNARESLIVTNHFIFDFIFYQCCRAINSFELLQENFIEQNSLEFKLEQLNSTLYVNFSQLCAGIHSENLCANNLAAMTLDGVKEYLTDTVSQILHKLFVNDTEHGTTYSSRASLQLAILKELARRKNFDDYIFYIKFPFKSIHKFINENIIDYSLKPHVLSNVMTNLDTNIQEILKDLIKAAHLANEETNTWEEWKLHYHNSISTVVRGVKLSDLDVLDVYIVNNYNQFSELLGQALKDSFAEFDWEHWVEDSLIGYRHRDLQHAITDTLIECTALCPFCREPCQLSAGEHEHYCGTFHRPQGISGWHYILSEEICTEECAEDVLLNNKFQYDRKMYNYADYRTVNDYFSTWKILGEDYIESKYWQWVLCIFHEEFVEYYEIERNNDIIIKWCHLTEEDVISDIERHYQNYTFKLS